MAKFSFIVVLGLLFGLVKGDVPCAARDVGGESVVCVCNSTFCDTFTRELLTKGTYVVYTSSKGGLRFQKVKKDLQTCNPLNTLKQLAVDLSVHPRKTFQTIIGFGGAVTDAAGINWLSLPVLVREALIKSYFGPSGLAYNMVRVPIGASDFSTHPYAYNELPVNDTKLSNFSLSYEDFIYKIPFIKAAMEETEDDILVLAATWSPPPWMKTNDAYQGNSRLEPEYYQTYADYHYKFIQKYTEEGIPIWGISTTNEPTDALLGLAKFNTLGWTAQAMGNWIVNNLGPTIRNSPFNSTKILAVDDQRLFLLYWWNTMIRLQPKVLDYIDGVGLHYYTDMLAPAALQVTAMAPYPDKFILNTEACEGSIPYLEKHVVPGSWQRAHRYISDIITNLNHNSVGWIDWNLCLNEEGGPNWEGNNVDSPIIVHNSTGEFYKQPMFYALGHFSKLIPRGSIRIGLWKRKAFSMETVAVLTPRNTIVVVVSNTGPAREVTIKMGSKLAPISCPEDSVTTVEMSYENTYFNL